MNLNTISLPWYTRPIKRAKQLRMRNCKLTVFRMYASSKWVGDHPQEDLAKFDYRLERKVEKFKIPSILWQHVGTCLDIVFSSRFQIGTTYKPSLNLFLSQQKGNKCRSFVHSVFASIHKYSYYITFYFCTISFCHWNHILLFMRLWLFVTLLGVN
jgi:hypothetical protein